MLTATTFGTWLRGDARGWVDDGVIYPADPQLEDSDKSRMKHDAYRFAPCDLERVGHAIGKSLRERLAMRIYAMSVQTWHVHVVVGETAHDVGRVVKCLKDAARYELRIGRPIWTKGYDKRFCFDRVSMMGRITYVEQHNIREGLPARPWDFIVQPPGI